MSTSHGHLRRHSRWSPESGSGRMAVACGAATLVTGVIAIVRHHDRSWSALLASVLGPLVLLVILREAAQGL